MLMKSPLTYRVIDDQAPALSVLQSWVRRMTCLRWLQVIGAWTERSRQRRDLAKLDDRGLADVGITRPEAAREIAKPFWR